IPGPPPRFDTDEMRDLLSYLWARQFFEDAGEPARGSRVFSSKHCAGCHGAGSARGPDLRTGQRSFNGAAMVSALWSHGPRMLEEMKSRGIPWPHFEAREMSDLIAYLNWGVKGR